MQAYIHEKSTNVALPKLDLFGVPPTQTQIEKTIVTEHRPITSFDGSPTIQFELQTLIDEYLDLEKLVIYFKVKLNKMTTIKDAKEWDMIAPVNYLLHSMIKQVDIFIGDHQITTSSPTYAYKAYLEAFFGFSHEMKKSHLTSALWFNDEDNREDVPVKDRSKFLKDNKELDLIGRLHSDLTFQGRSLLGGCRLTIRIILNDAKFYMMSTAGHSPQLEILDTSLFVHRAKLAEKTVAAHNKALTVASAKYPITVNKIKNFTIQAGAIDWSIENVHSGQLPRRIIIAFVSNEGFNGNYTKNPYNFQHYNLSNLVVYMGGEQYPNKGFNPDFNNNLYAKEYYALYEGIDMVDCDPTFKINRGNFKNGNAFFVVNFAPDLTNGPGLIGHVNKLSYGTLRIALRFGTALPEAITVLVFCEFDKLMEIDINRKIHLDTF